MTKPEDLINTRCSRCPRPGIYVGRGSDNDSYYCENHKTEAPEGIERFGFSLEE